MEAECLHQFGVTPRKADCRGSFIKLTWFRGLKDRIFSWGSACLAHLYRSLCRATRVDCKEMDGPLTLLLTWTRIWLPFLAPIPDNPRLFSIANRWRNWDRENYAYWYHSLPHYKRLLDDMQEGHFVWQAYGIGHIDPDLIPLNIHHNSIIWSATVPLISFECVEWHTIDRIRRQFGLSQGVPNQERDLGASHGEVLTGSKNQDWAVTHSLWVMQWTNRYSHVLVDEMGPSHYSLNIYMHWYRRAFGVHLQLSDLVVQEDPEGPPIHNQENQQQQPAAPAPPHPPSPPLPPPPPLPQQDLEYFVPYIPHTHPSDYFSLSVPVQQQYWGGMVTNDIHAFIYCRNSSAFIASKSNDCMKEGS
ncbi:hypothetical protein Ahy_A06g029942 [Arachis hypogaea]|uniref:Aminotransferase-like plant mobile domain-containing protein n=1 Tax=Arachis hypogaea TaxID=3818 RepID=A0A445CUP6_ARAHY|nr:hypothetical protein Ahy_A06g029942 [Arachis hypogaea]